MIFIKPKAVLDLLGSFWTRIFTSAKLVQQLFKGALSNYSQSEQSVSELVVSSSNLEVPAGTTTTWETFVLGLYSQQPEEYGVQTSKYGTSYFYGQIDSNKASYIIDETILDIPFLYDSIVAPTKIYTKGVDYKLAKGKLIFKKPFAFVVRLYARNVVREAGFVTSRLGYALDLQLADSVYRDIPFSDIWRLYTYGPNYLNLMSLLAAASDGVVVKSNSVVESLTYYGSLLEVITDKDVYYVPVSKVIPLSEGQALPSGTSLTSAVQILHDKQILVGGQVPEIYRDKNLFKYGSQSAKASSMVIIKADISGERSLSIKVLKNTMPSDTKVLILTNTSVDAATVSDSHLSAQTVSTAVSKVLEPAIFDENNVSVSSTQKLKYTSYGY